MPLLPNPDSPDEFEYDGWLSFYPFQTDVRGDFSEYGSHSDIRDIINNNLPSYRQGTPEDPGNGFEALMTPDLIRDANLIDRYPHLESLHHIKYIQEEYQQMMVYNEESDDFEERSTVEIASSDIFWSFPNYLFGRGSKKDIKEIHHRLRSSLVNSLRIERFAFKPEFLVWIIYKFYEGEQIDGRVSLEQIQSIETTGDTDSFGHQASLSGIQGAPTMSFLPILEGNAPTKIEGLFEYFGEELVVRINQDRIRVLGGQGTVSELSDLETMALAVSLVTELTRIYSDWEFYTNEEKYPPTSFFKSLYRDAFEEGYETHGIAQEVIEKYSQLREER